MSLDLIRPLVLMSVWISTNALAIGEGCEYVADPKGTLEQAQRRDPMQAYSILWDTFSTLKMSAAPIPQELVGALASWRMSHPWGFNLSETLPETRPPHFPVSPPRDQYTGVVHDNGAVEAVRKSHRATLFTLNSTRIRELQGTHAVSLSPSPDAKHWVLIGRRRDTLSIYVSLLDSAGNPVEFFPTVQEAGFQPVFSPDGRHMIINRVFYPGPTRIVDVWNLRNGTKKQLSLRHSHFPDVVTFSADSRHIVHLHGSTLSVVQTNDLAKLTVLNGIDNYEHSPDGTYLLLLDKVGNIIFSTYDGKHASLIHSASRRSNREKMFLHFPGGGNAFQIFYPGRDETENYVWRQ